MNEEYAALTNPLIYLSESSFDINYSYELSLEFIKEQNEKQDKNHQIQFDQDIWAIIAEETGSYRHIFCDKFKNIAGVNQSNYTIIKCWIASLIDSYSAHYVFSLTHYFSEFVRESNFFNPKQLENSVKFLRFQKNERIMYDIALATLNFIDYYPEIDPDFEYSQQLSDIRETYNADREYNPRTLPPSKEIVQFNWIVNDYFSKIDKESNEYLFYFPILLWWKLTMIIPLRPAELATIERNCLKEKGEKTYIKLPRKKIPKNRVQIIDKIMISTELAIKIKDYVANTEQFGKTKTLLHPFVQFINGANVSYEDKYSYVKLITHLKMFYKNIVFKKYGYSMKFNNKGVVMKANENELGEYNISTPIKPGDTRHFSMLNLMRQGYHPIEIARLAGHSSIHAQRGYYIHLEYWVDTEVLILMENLYSEISSSVETSVYDIVDEDFKNRYILNPNKSQIQIPLDLGYCTNPNQNCPVEEHFQCEYWRLAPEDLINNKDKIVEIIKESDSKVKQLLSILTNLQSLALKEVGTELDYSENDYLYYKDLISIRNQLDIALHQYSKVSQYRHSYGKLLKEVNLINDKL